MTDHRNLYEAWNPFHRKRESAEIITFPGVTPLEHAWRRVQETRQLMNRVMRRPAADMQNVIRYRDVQDELAQAEANYLRVIAEI